MDIPQAELFSVLQEFNPWWAGHSMEALPTWERSASRQVWAWVESKDSQRALLLTGARQTGKTTLLRQAIRKLCDSGFPREKILYATFDHPILKLAGIQKTLQAWDSLYPRDANQPRFLFLDEIQNVPDWQVWLKHQVDFQKRNRIAVTGSASPLRSGSTESGVGRWETIPLATLSFGEFLRLKNIDTPQIPRLDTFRELFEWSSGDFARVAMIGRDLIAHFHDYLLRGGFPEPALATDLVRCQRLLREDIVDKVLKRDMTAFYGVRRVLEVEKLFLYLCYHDGGMIDLATISKEIQSNKQSVINFLDLFEATHLVYRLRSFGYGKEVLRGRDKIYLADAALAGSVLLMGRKLLEKPDRLGAAVETAVFKHLFSRYYQEMPHFSYWRDTRKKEHEVDVIAEMGGRILPFEVKYQDLVITPSKLKGLRIFLEERKLDHGYVISQRWDDFGLMDVTSALSGREKERLTAKVVKIPAPLACYWLSE